MDGGLMAASLISSPPLYLRTAVFLSNQVGPPQTVIDAITSKLVLILGRFTPERKTILDAIRDELRKRD
jgi:hypothetical protein